jgi:hypothetical protein
MVIPLITILAALTYNIVSAADHAVLAALPSNAQVYLPLLRSEATAQWPTNKNLTLLAAQIEQETCLSMKHSKCWSPLAELKTDREWGVGFGQFTKTSKFDTIKELRDRHKDLFGNWSFDNPYQPVYQMRGLVVYMRNINSSIKNTTNDDERYAMTLSAYNGGQGGLMKDRMLCNNTPGCDNTKWWGNTESTSFKAKTAVKGYGKSFYTINREYVVQIMKVRYKKYEGAF